jgi:hypothetical protein
MPSVFAEVGMDLVFVSGVLALLILTVAAAAVLARVDSSGAAR